MDKIFCVLMSGSMQWLRYILTCGLAVFAALQIAQAQTGPLLSEVVFADPSVTVCLASEDDTAPPENPADICQDTDLGMADPQNAHLWVFLNMTIPGSMLDSYEPLGIGVSAKASSFIYINGKEVGRNGQPAGTAKTEIEGRMDVMFPLRDGVLQAGVNEVAMRLSSHSGYLKLDDPIHSIYVTAYEKPQSRIARRYAPTLLPFGVFVLGGLYFLIMSIVGRLRVQSALLVAMSIIIACQLLAEVSRGLFAYAYPFHDLRLIVIVACSAFFGLTLSLYVTRVFGKAHFKYWAVLICLTTAFALILPSGFDRKALLLLLSQIILSLIISLIYWRHDPIKTAAFASVLSIFAAVNFFSQGQFLDVYFFYGIAALMLFLFVQQALAYGQEQALRQEEKFRANKLQLILDQQRETSQPDIISLSEAGQVHRVATDDIISISGAGDYVEVKLKSGKSRLISSTLAEMEAALPSFFLRVHRSHIVNTSLIKSLARDPSGTGLLTLVQGGTVPVSRRIMPRVREALV